MALAGISLLAILSAYGFVSSSTIDPRLISSHYAPAGPAFATTVTFMTKNAWHGSLLPVSTTGNLLSDFQLGYALWLLLLIGGAMALRRRGPGTARALSAMILLYLAALTPVPGLHRALWEYLPASIATMTNFWPMQRLYLLLSIAIVFLAALTWPRFRRPWPATARWLVPVALAASAGWSGWQAWHFIRHGFSVRYSAQKTEAIHRLENANLTVVAYAFLGYPSWFSFGPMDPEESLHLLSPTDLSVIVSDAAFGHVRPAAASGRLRLVHRAGGALDQLEPQITIDPGKKYRLRFHFLTPKFDGILMLRGETARRDYLLPSYVGAKGFGMEPGNNPEITLFTTSPRPEHLQLSVQTADGIDPPWTDFADYTLEEIDRTVLPLQLVRLVPFLECRFDAPQACWLETPRMYIEGYAATVDGKPAPNTRSSESMVMVAVPAGRHTLQLRYVGSPLLRRTFFLALWGWVAVAAGLIAKTLF
jgi:hypothetical protein